MAHVAEATNYSLQYVHFSGIIGSYGRASSALLGVVETSGAYYIPFSPLPYRGQTSIAVRWGHIMGTI